MSVDFVALDSVIETIKAQMNSLINAHNDAISQIKADTALWSSLPGSAYQAFFQSDAKLNQLLVNLAQFLNTWGTATENVNHTMQMAETTNTNIMA
jgi:uncharacterized protein YukE